MRATKGTEKAWAVPRSPVLRRARRSAVPAGLVAQIDEALEAVDAARTEVESAITLESRRLAHAHLRRAFDTADSRLREAVSLARSDSSLIWSRWRARLSRLDVARQAHLFAEMDDSGVLLPGEVRIADYGMSGPDIGEAQLGSSSPAGTPACIGLELATVLGNGRHLSEHASPKYTRPERSVL